MNLDFSVFKKAFAGINEIQMSEVDMGSYIGIELTKSCFLVAGLFIVVVGLTWLLLFGGKKNNGSWNKKR